MKHFNEILLTLGASRVDLLAQASDWDFWRAEYRTPVSNVYGYYLYLKHKCPLKEATSENVRKWEKLSGKDGYELIVTPRSPLSQNPPHTKETFRARKIRTTKELLHNSYIKDLIWRPVSFEEYFIDPDLELESGETRHGATEFLRSWLVGSSTAMKSTSLSVLIANGGVGKTTLSRVLCERIHRHDPTAIPILIESDQWKHLIQTNITMDVLWDLAISRRFDQANRLKASETALRVLIQEGLFVVIFDGFDELCTNPSCAYKPQDVINELNDMLTSEDEIFQARILLTSRKTFWESIADDIDLGKIEVFRLKGFDNEQRKRYFEARLTDPAKRDLALRLSKQISGGIYDDIAVEGRQEERLSGVPFILDLIARHVYNNPEKEINPYIGDPLEGLLRDVCRRENLRQSLNIDPGTQLILFEELFREFQTSLSFDDLKFYLECICGVTDHGVVQRFTNHVFLTRLEKDVYAPRYEVLRVYFVARFLAQSLESLERKSNRQTIARLLAANSTGRTQVMDWLVRQLNRLESNRLHNAITHAIDIIDDKENMEVRKASSMALFHLVNKLVTGSDKQERTKDLLNYFRTKTKDEGKTLTRTLVTGLMKSFDLSDICFADCIFIDVEFRNCRFGTKTKLVNCSFEGLLAFDNCEGEREIDITDGSFSKEAEFMINFVRNKGIRLELKEAFAEDALSRALKKFKGDYGFVSIQYRHRTSGFKPGNPYNKKIWEVLLHEKIAERHTISNVEEGGLNIVDDKELRREITTYLDNAILGPRLTAVIDELLK